MILQLIDKMPPANMQRLARPPITRRQAIEKAVRAVQHRWKWTFWQIGHNRLVSHETLEAIARDVRSAFKTCYNPSESPM